MHTSYTALLTSSVY